MDVEDFSQANKKVETYYFLVFNLHNLHNNITMNHTLKLHSEKITLFVFAMIIGIALAVGGSAWATSLGTNVSVTGSLTASSTMAITGVSTLYGNLAVNGYATTTASTGTFSTVGSVYASSTLAVTGTSYLYGNLLFNGFATTTVSNGNIASNGSLYASSTLTVTGVTNLYGNLLFNGFATTTASNGNIATNGSLGVATSTPGQELGVTGDALLGGAGTTTLYSRSTTSGAGGCIELLGTDSVTYRIYAGATTTNSGRLIVEVGSCK